MNAKTLLLIALISIAFGCRTKNKVITNNEEKKQESEKVKIDSLSSQSQQSVQNSSSETLSNNRKDEQSGEILIKGRSDQSSPFVYHNIVVKDTLQSISIVGNAEYIINTHYVKSDNKISETKKEQSVTLLRNDDRKVISRKTQKESDLTISAQTKKIKVTGFQAGAWIVLAIVAGIIILAFFTYKYFKK
ncbi:hypothetical protein [Chryseobacterium mucoviscidosis]|uniref:hypothetical protein n=1 Tax=Chryseobacterium mucoviscidosis TaxID=1945581 RepID=UPI0031DE4961